MDMEMVDMDMVDMEMVDMEMVDMEMVDMDQLADLSRTFGLVLYLSIFLDGKKQQQCWW